MLIEAMVALIIVSVGLTGVVMAVRQSLSAGRQARNLTTATMLAQQKLAEVRALPPQVIGTQQGDFGKDFPGFAWRLQIDPVDKEEFFQVRVDVTWRQHGQEKSATLASLIRIEPGGK